MISNIDEDDFGDLAALCLVSHTFNVIATKQLYGGNLWLVFPAGGRPYNAPTSRRFKLKRTLVARPDLAAKFKTLTLDLEEDLYPFRKKDSNPNLAPALDLLHTAIDLATNVTRLCFGYRCVQSTFDSFLRIILSNTPLAARLTSLRVYAPEWKNYYPYEIEPMLEALPRLTDVYCSGMKGWPYGPLTSFATNATLKSDSFNGLDSSRTTLREVRFWTGDEDYPDWTTFINLKHVTISINYQAERGETNRVLETCLVAETIKLSVDGYNVDRYHICELKTLHSIPTSIVNLDISHSNGVATQYMIDWIRDGASRWPHLRELIVLRAKEGDMDGRYCWGLTKARAQELADIKGDRKVCSFKTREELDQECEEVCAERGIRLRWIPFHVIYCDSDSD